MAASLRMDASPDSLDMLSVDEAAALLNVSRHTLINWRSARKGPPGIRVGRTVRYRRAAVAKWLAEQEQIELDRQAV